MIRLLPALLLALLAFPTSVRADDLALRRFHEAHPAAQVHQHEATGAASLITDLSVDLPAGAEVPALQRFLDEWPGVLGYEPGLTTFAEPRKVGAAKATVYRFSQQHQGLPVLSADVAATVDEHGRLVMIGGSLQVLPRLDTRFGLSGEQALQAALRRVGATEWSGKPHRLRQVLAPVDGEFRAVWQVEFLATRPLGAWRVLVAPDAPEALSVVNTLRHAEGYAYPNSPEVGAYQSVTLDRLTSTTTITGNYVDLYSNCMPGDGCSSSNKKARATGGNFLIAPNEGSSSDGFAEVHTYYAIDRLHAWFKSVNNFNGLDFPLPIGVNYTDPYGQGYDCNAGYGQGSIIVGLCPIGGGQYRNFAYDAVILMHEYTHGAVDTSAGFAEYATDTWGLVGMQAGLHEGFADSLPALFLNDSVIGRHIGTAMPEAMRDLSQTHVCPDNLDGESHEDGKLWGSSNWAAYTASGRSPDVAKAIFQGLVGLGTTPTFKDAANAVIAASKSYPSAVQAAIAGAYQSHGMTTCGRELSIATGKTYGGGMLHPYYVGLSGSTAPFLAQYRVDVPANSTSLSFQLSAVDENGANVVSSTRFYVNQGTNVIWRSTPTAGWNSAGKASLVISNPAAGPYFVLPVGVFGSYGPAQIKFTLRATVIGGTPGADAGTPGPDASTCLPNCAGRSCGTDGCGGNCGTCSSGYVCNVSNCVALAGPDASTCLPNCAGRSCGTDGCGGNCGTCSSGYVCNVSNCVALPGPDASLPGPDASACVPNCAGRSCGSNGCGGSCGSCPNGTICNVSTCVALPGPDASLPGPDASLPGPDASLPGPDSGSACIPNCTGRSCGSDGCGSICGLCPSGSVCNGSVCMGEGDAAIPPGPDAASQPTSDAAIVPGRDASLTPPSDAAEEEEPGRDASTRRDAATADASTPVEPKGCGCGAAPGTDLGALALLGLVGLRRRRRG